ncbi:hypothetical protein OKA04_19265 [Luteolibacter flavescens]|uniref:Lipoprotein n=1 Tax=Luteolibacter flavescens TaxID=1859460 RepID=A0ABT3FTI0_9BACT|nr:hypothetical protein [Luteolibacter flavescens]MCW1886888.1 hypothetical protein [Luteolibacter flavescens]
MKFSRRHWICLAGSALCGCKGRGSSGGTGSTAVDTDPRVQAGPFSVEVPLDWKPSARVEEVPANPLYTTGEWQQVVKAREANEVPAVYKPQFASRPRHWAIRLPGSLPKDLNRDPGDPGESPTAPQILIHKADEWAAIFTDGVDGKDKSAETILKLREGMDAAIKGEGKAVVPAFMDASLSFQCLRKRIDFEGGHGVRLLAQWTTEPELLRENQLHYLFLGLSDDDSCQIIATFPVTLPGLPEEYVTKAEHLGRSTERHEELGQNFEAYEKDAAAWLEQHAAEINPGLETLDKMLETLVVRKWD